MIVIRAELERLGKDGTVKIGPRYDDPFPVLNALLNAVGAATLERKGRANQHMRCPTISVVRSTFSQINLSRRDAAAHAYLRDPKPSVLVPHQSDSFNIGAIDSRLAVLRHPSATYNHAQRAEMLRKPHVREMLQRIERLARAQVSERTAGTPRSQIEWQPRPLGMTPRNASAVLRPHGFGVLFRRQTPRLDETASLSSAHRGQCANQVGLSRPTRNQLLRGRGLEVGENKPRSHRVAVDAELATGL